MALRPDKPLQSYEAGLPTTYTSSSSRPTGPNNEPAVNFACITMNMNDRLRLIKFDDPDIAAVREVILQHWGTIQAEQVYNAAYEFKLKGTPWMEEFNKLRPAGLLCAIFECLFNRGWILTMSSADSGKGAKMDTLFFTKEPSLPTPCNWMYICWCRGDIMQVNNALGDFVEEITRVVFAHFQIQKHRWNKHTPNTYEYQLQGFPFNPSGEATVTLRLFFLAILEVLGRHGFSLYGSVHHITESNDIDTWFFRRLQD